MGLWRDGREMDQGKGGCIVVRERCKVDDLDAPPPESETTQAPNYVSASSAHEARMLQILSLAIYHLPSTIYHLLST